MRKKFLTKLLAFVMSAGLILQPVTTFAVEPGEDDLTDPVVEEVEEVEENLVLDKMANSETVLLPDTAPTLQAEIKADGQLPYIQNVYIQDGVLYWDPIPNAAFYWIGIGNLSAYYTYDTSSNLSQKCEELKAKTDNYKITLTAVDSSWQDVSQESTLYYYYESPIIIRKVTNVSVTSDIDTVLVDGGEVKALTFTNVSDDAAKIEFSFWQKLENGSWNVYGEKTFTPGTYRYWAALYISEAHYYDSQLDKDATLTIDGIEYAVNQRNYTGNNEIWCTIYTTDGFEAKKSTEPEIPTPGKQIPVSLIEVTSNYAELAKYDAPVIDADFGENDDDPVEIEGRWYVKGDDGTWSDNHDKFFTPGKYRYQVDIYVPESYHGMYYLEDDLEFKVNGEDWTLISDDAGTMTFVSEEFNIEKPAEPIEKIKLTSANVTCDYLDGFKNGKLIRKANFSSEDIDLSMFDIQGNWFKDVGDGKFALVSSKTFTPGTYEYELTLVLKEEYADKYEFDDNFELTVNGTEKWRHHPNKDGDTDRATFYSGYHEITESKITVIPSIETTSNIGDIFVKGNDFAEPKFVNSEESYYVVCHWVERDDGDGFHPIDVNGKVTPGTYRVGARVSIQDDDYALSEDTKLIVDGQKWDYSFTLGSNNGNIMVAVFNSPEIVIKEDIPIVGEGQWVTKYGVTYYEYPGGIKVTGFHEIDGDEYYFNDKGVLQKQTWITVDGDKYYALEDGKIAKDQIIVKWGQNYYLDEDGVLQTGFITIDDEEYYANAKGVIQKQTWITYDGDKYYAKGDGTLAKSETIVKWGKKYSFDEYGILITKERPIL